MENKVASIGYAMQVKASLGCCWRQFIAQEQESSPAFLTNEGAAIAEAIGPLEGRLHPEKQVDRAAWQLR
jgi:hypothetical protein